MLDRAPQDDPATEVRPVAFRGAGFMPGGGRASGWIGLALVIALWQLAGSVRRLVFSPDGQFLATGNGNGTVYILRLITPK